MTVFLILIWAITILEAIETNSLTLPVEYQPYQIPEQEENTEWISDCRNKWPGVEAKIVHRNKTVTAGGCIELAENFIVRQGEGRSGQRTGHVCKGPTLAIDNRVLEHWSLSLIIYIDCPSSYSMQLLTWQDTGIQVVCTPTNPPRLHVTWPGGRLTYNTARGIQTHILIQPSSHVPSDRQSTGSLAVYINGSCVTPESKEQIHKKHSTQLQRNTAALSFGSDKGRHIYNPSSVMIGALNLFRKVLTNEEIKKESHFMYLRSINADYPECLCTEPPPYGTDSCPNGEDRLRGAAKDKPFLPLRAVMDGIINPGSLQGFWPARPKDVIYLRLHAPTWLFRIEIYMFSQPVTVFKDRCECGKWHPLFCASGLGESKQHQHCDEGTEGEEDYSWDPIERSSSQKLNWLAKRDVHVVRTLKIEFEGGPYQDVSIYTKPLEDVNPIYEIRVFGSVLVTTLFPEGMGCFPGNGNCKQEHCRDGKTLSINKCRPYIRSVVPDYGPISGGTVLTFSGGLLRPDLYEINHEPNTTILRDRDISLCDNILRTDENISCRTRRFTDDEDVGISQPLKVSILIDGALYSINSQLNFTYKPNPIIESITPYKSFLKEGHRITVKGQHLDSIFIRPEQRIMNISLERKQQFKYKAACSVESNRAMVCILPVIEDNIIVKAHLGLILDGFTKYQNLTAALHLTEPMMFYQKPHFREVAIIHLKKGASELMLKGDMINSGCTAAEYTVKIGESECKVVKIDYHTLYCSPQYGKHTNGKLVVQLYDITYNIGSVYYEDPSIGPASIAIIISIAVLLLILVVIGLIIIWWKRKIYHRRLSDWDVPQEVTEQQIAPDNSGPSQPLTLRPFSELLKDIMEGIELDSKNLEIKEEIGCGNWGKVYHGNLCQGKYSREVAVKTLKDRHEMDSATLNEFLSEATIMKGFSHPNVLSLLGITIEDGQAFVILPYMDHGDLRGFVQNSRFEEVRFTKLVYNVAKGMNYLAEQKFVHRDLAARNCMVDSSENVMIGDFGLAHDIHENDYYRPKDRSQPLPYKWMALESIEDISFTMKSDVWSYGVTMWEVYSHGAKPYPDIKNFQMRSYLKRGLRLDKPPTCHSEIYDLMSQCWKMDPSDRPSFVLIVSKLEQFLLQRAATSSVKPKNVTDQVAIMDTGLQPTPCKTENNGAEMKPSVKTVIEDKATLPVYGISSKDGAAASACAETREKQDFVADEAKAIFENPGTFTTCDDACDSSASSIWDSVSSLSDEGQGIVQPERKTASVPTCPMLAPRSNMKSCQNEENDYLQPVCNQCTSACGPGKSPNVDK